MNILVTSGGTQIPIDPVRSITNTSRGTFGSAIAQAALNRDHHVTFLHAKYSKIPQAGWSPGLDYASVEFITFDQYATRIYELMKANKYDAVILAAAVSDYGVKQSESKIRTQSELNLQLYPLPKIISRIKRYQPNTFLVGFKMLINGSKMELIEEAAKSLMNNHCDLVVANNWRQTEDAIVMQADGVFRSLSPIRASALVAANNLIELIECGISSLQPQVPSPQLYSPISSDQD